MYSNGTFTMRGADSRLFSASLISTLFVSGMLIVFQANQLSALFGLEGVFSVLGYGTVALSGVCALGKVRRFKLLSSSDFWLLGFVSYILLRSMLSVPPAIALADALILATAGAGLYFLCRLVFVNYSSLTKITTFVSAGLIVSTLSFIFFLDPVADARATLALDHNAVGFSQVIVSSGSVILGIIYFCAFGDGR